MTAWQVEVGGIVVGKIRERDCGMPFTFFEFEPTPEFASVRQLFADGLRLLNADRMDEWQVAYDRISSRGLKLRSIETGKVVDEVLLHIDDSQAWFRCQDDRPTAQWSRRASRAADRQTR